MLCFCEYLAVELLCSGTPSNLCQMGGVFKVRYRIVRVLRSKVHTQHVCSRGMEDWILTPLETRPTGPRCGPRQAVPYPYLQHADRPTATRGGGSRRWITSGATTTFNRLYHFISQTKPTQTGNNTTPLLFPINHQRSIRPTVAAPFPDNFAVFWELGRRRL